MPESSDGPSAAGTDESQLLRQDRHASRSDRRCPSCAQPGKPVPGQTIKALLAVSLRAVEASDYRFCRTSACPVVYFAVCGEQVFTTRDLRERVYEKEPDAETVLVCYCFRYLAGDVRAAPPHEQALIVDTIVSGIQAGQCACDIRNPQGSCCLGNVRALIARSRQDSAGHAER